MTTLRDAAAELRCHVGLSRPSPSWLQAAGSRATAFPYQVDALSQLITWVEDWRIRTWSVRPMW